MINNYKIFIVRNILLVFLIIFSISAYSQNKTNLLDYADKEYNKDDIQIKNGLLYSNSYYDSKLLSGNITVVDYYNSGELLTEERYRNGKLYARLEYFKSGGCSSLIEYKNGKQHGLLIEYCRTAKKCFKAVYKNGILHGLQQAWYENGRLHWEVNYQNGKKEGEYKEYYQNGNLSEKGKYYYGNREGQWVYYNKDGSIQGGEYY